jgi:quercetin dioxygenase-like cupin family protein
MNRQWGFALAAGIAAASLAFGAGVAVGQSAPTENKGLKVSPPTALELDTEIDSLEGRQLRLRVVTIEPGGVAALHSHNGRPAVAYIAQGTLTEHREGAGTTEHRTGESFSEGKSTTHWAENKGSEAVIVIAVDVFKP